MNRRVVNRPADRRRVPGLPALLVALVAAALLTVQAAVADSKTADARLGDDVHGEVHAGESDTWRLALVAGTDLSLRAKSGDEDRPVVLTLFDPAGAPVATRSGERPRIDVTVTVGGTWRAEIRPEGEEAEYELEIRGDPPQQTGGGTTGPGGGTVHLDVPRGALVRIDVRRLSGAAPEVTAVRDGLGRAIDVEVSRRRKSSLRLREIPVTGPGGIDVDVRGEGGADGTYEVNARIEHEDDDDHSGSSDGERAARRLVLALAPGADPAQVAAALGYELKEVRAGFIVVETPEGREGFENEDAADADDRSDDVLGAEPDAIVAAPDVPDGSQINGVVLGSDFGRTAVQEQPAIAQIRAAAAQRIATGTGVVVAVLDTGVDGVHEALAGHVLPGRDFVDGDADASETTNGLDDDGDGQVDEGYGHGTFVAGLVLAVAPNVQILPVRVLDTDARGTVSSIAAGIEWAADNGADVVNLSLGMDATSGVLGDAVRYALTKGVVVVAATGNQGAAASVEFPASIAGVVAVTATDEVGAPAPFANGGTGTTAAAPGDAVVGPYPDGRYGTWSGTSFSAALASGGAALLVQAQPGVTPAQVLTRVRRSARPKPSLAPRLRRRLGAGRIDVRRLLG